MDNINPYFNFLSEIRKANNYKLLYPEAKVGLAIIWLYERIVEGSFPGGTFKESDIHKALAEVNSRAETSLDTRHPKEHYNTILSDLQEYFLRYDDEKQVYSFKVYGVEFCRQAFDILKANFDPTRIEKICLELKNKLTEATSRSLIIEWFTISYETFRPQLKQQIDFLDRQIDHSVADFRMQINLSSTKITDLLKQVDTRLDNIRRQNKELRAAFTEIDFIRHRLETIEIEYNDREIGDRVYDAFSFFREMKYVLGLIDNRLDRIQPKIKQLFGNLNKPLFNVRVEKFLLFILNKSTVGIDGSKKQVIFPNNLPSPLLYFDTPSFTIFERKRDLFPALKKKRLTVNENVENRKNAIETSIKKILQQDEVNNWLDRIEVKVKTKLQVEFGPIFFKILQEKGGDIELGVNVAYRLIRECRTRDLKVEIKKIKIGTKPLNNVAIWEMTITKATP